ncbi:MAG: EVE domain-containing protein [Ignavibacteria bacterium]|nr:EVE domain-containing protein [Ignavibacteria bacterium]
MKYWIFKSEPGVFSWNDLLVSENQTTYWDGVRNYQARNFLRDEVNIGDLVFFYHSNSEPLAIIGFCKVVKAGYPDFTALDPKSEHFDPASSTENPRWYMVDIKAEHEFKSPVTLEILKQSPGLEELRLLQKGNRLSIIPVTKQEAGIIQKLGR